MKFWLTFVLLIEAEIDFGMCNIKKKKLWDKIFKVIKTRKIKASLWNINTKDGILVLLLVGTKI